MPALAKGFTLVELIGVIAIAGILATVAAPRFFNTATFASRGYFDAAAGFLRYAQKLAIARHGDVSVLVGVGGLTLCRTASAPCSEANAIPGPDGTTPFQANVPNGVSLSASVTSLSFDALGRPSAGASFSISGDPNRSLTVEAETGYVH